MLNSCRAIFRCAVAFALLLCTAAAITLAQNPPGGSPAPDSSFQNYAQSAAAARDAGQIDDALRAYQAALKIDPSWQEGWWNLGTILYDRDRYAEAIPAFRTLAELAPQASPAWTFLGLCEFETKDYANAVEHLTKGEALGGVDDAEIARVAKYHLALLLIRSGEFDHANAVLRDLAMEGHSSPQVTFALGLTMLHVPLLPAEVNPSREGLVQYAGAIAAAGDSAGESTAFKAAIAKYPDAPYLHYAFGEVLVRDGKLQEALVEFRREADISPQSALAQLGIARAELRLGLAKDALPAAREAVRLAPDSQVAHEWLAQCLGAMGQQREARAESKSTSWSGMEQILPHMARTRGTRTIRGRTSEAGAVAMRCSARRCGIIPRSNFPKRSRS